MADPASRRERHAATRRQDILMSAVKVFGEKGFDRATTREIAAQADLSEGSIYRYFHSKQDLLMGIVKEVVPELMGETLFVGGPGDLATRLTEGFERLIALLCERRAMLKVLAGEVWHSDEILEEWVAVAGQELMARLAKRLEAYVALGTLRPLDPSVAARMVLFAAVGVALPIIRGVWELPTQAERHKLALTLADLLLNGMAAHPA